MKKQTESLAKPFPAKVEASLQNYRANQQRRIEQRNRWQWKLFKWDLFVLPINCEEVTPDRPSGPITKFEDLVRQPVRLILLTGAPGSGKTTACRRLMAKPPPIVVPLNIGRLEALNKSSIFDFLSNALGVESKSMVNRIEHTGRLFFIVDGLGERTDADVVARSLRTLTRQFAQSRFIVTCRNNDYDESWLPRFRNWNIQKLSLESQNSFIKTQPPTLRRRFRRGFATDNHFHEILSNQFLLFLAARLMAEPAKTPIQHTKLGLYNAFLDIFLRDWEKVKVGQRDFILRVLQEIAVVMRKGYLLRSYRSEQDVARLIRDHLSCQGACEPSERDIQETLHEIFQHGLLVKERGLIGFFQETFQEFLCARWLCDQRALPRDLRKRGDKVYYKDVQMSDVILDFYRKMIDESPVLPPASGRGQPPHDGTVNQCFDVFLSHNSKDKPAVRQLAEELKKRGLRVWLDEWELVPGRPWQEALEEIIQTTKSAAVLVGADGLGPWEIPEMRGCLSEFMDRRLSVIPVLLPGASQQPVLPLFLKRFAWVDFREGLTNDGLDRLVWGITGKKP